jgi:hypothetical protein
MICISFSNKACESKISKVRDLCFAELDLRSCGVSPLLNFYDFFMGNAIIKAVVSFAL